MKIDANVEFSETISKEIGEFSCKIPVDIDYVDDDYESINDWVRNELEYKWHRPFLDRDFIITNINDIIEDIKFDEFQEKTN